MNGESLRRSVIITNPQGLHMRPITTFTELAKTFTSTVDIIKKGERFNGKSPLALLGLGAEQGTELTLEVLGADQDQAMNALGDLLARLAEAELPDAAKGSE